MLAMNKPIKVSILIPIYNASKTIESCLTSVLEQTYSNIEYILVNDGSTDNSVEIVHAIIAKYPNRKNNVQILENVSNRGISYTRNVLLNKATGDYIYFVDSDDYVFPNAIELLVDVVEKTSAEIVRTNYFECKDGKLDLKENVFTDNKDEFIFNAIKSSQNLDALWKLFIKRNLFIENQLYFSSKLNACEDYVMTIKLFCVADKIIDSKLSVYCYMIDANPNSITKTNELQLIIDKINSLLEIESFLKECYLYEKFKLAVISRMVICKQVYLLNNRHYNINKYYETFPEAIKSWRLFNYSSKERFLFWIAEHKMTILLDLYHRFSLFKNNYLGKL